MATPNPMPPLPPPPPISSTTLPITGLLVDIYGLDELPPTATSVSCLWLHHPRLRTRGDMAAIAARCVSAYNDSLGGGSGASPGGKRGLIAAAFDQRNHGSRQVHPRANESWRDGNATHAQDMFGTVAGAVADTRVLMDALGGYLFHEEDAVRREIDQHLVLGISLGGHSGWQLMFADERVRAGVLVIGCPDFAYLLSDRARLSRLPTYKEGTDSFLGSSDFPPALVRHCCELDPKALLFGAETQSTPSGQTDQKELARLKAILDARIRGKKFLVQSGGDDKLVPYRCSRDFVTWLEAAAADGDGGFVVDNRVYEGVGHVFSEEMVRDAVKFVVDVVNEAGDGRPGGGKGTSKI
ncbi:Alpha/beta-hydrolase [Pleurostoma richardsiae]|uniref:Alpha/beta-hydrolase n=1 Tax=Pleurostoma richardsiae TaxID=41990 RepID=A0AA38SBH8_9PEZI|nr:Alpha/beta-hydrolase [Pleurostoma richardsiae]